MLLHKAALNLLFRGPLLVLKAPPLLCVPPYKAASYECAPAGSLPSGAVCVNRHTQQGSALPPASSLQD